MQAGFVFRDVVDLGKHLSNSHRSHLLGRSLRQKAAFADTQWCNKTSAAWPSSRSACVCACAEKYLIGSSADVIVSLVFAPNVQFVYFPDGVSLSFRLEFLLFKSREIHGGTIQATQTGQQVLFVCFPGTTSGFSPPMGVFSISQAWRQAPTDEGHLKNLPPELGMSAKVAHSELGHPRLWSNKKCPQGGHVMVREAQF